MCVSQVLETRGTHFITCPAGALTGALDGSLAKTCEVKYVGVVDVFMYLDADEGVEDTNSFSLLVICSVSCSASCGLQSKNTIFSS